jgi:pseudaminic acid cytidylyltransferase
MNNIAIIPARGGSKRIPRKNIRIFAGKPMIAHSIDIALRSELFDRVIVSTDDEDIAEVALHHGAEVPFIRPEALSGDYIGLAEVIAHTLDRVAEKGREPLAACCILATAPFIQIQDIKKGLDLLNGGGWQYVLSATTFGSSIFRGFKSSDTQGLEMFFPSHVHTRSQDLPEAMHDAGQFYWGRPQAWRERLSVLDKWTTLIELPSWRVQDIDTKEDWSRAELIYNLMTKE